MVGMIGTFIILHSMLILINYNYICKNYLYFHNIFKVQILNIFFKLFQLLSTNSMDPLVCKEESDFSCSDSDTGKM